jgi:hypothetical protein
MIMEIMHKFGEATGLKINQSKSTVVSICCVDVNLDEVLSSFQGNRVAFPFKYLGLPITLGRLKLIHLQSVLDQAAGKLAGWQCSLLNAGGHRELVKTVLSVLPTYLLTAIKVPKDFFGVMDKIRRKFLWAGQQHLHGGKCKVNWSGVCRPLHRAGLGITDLERFGRAL